MNSRVSLVKCKSYEPNLVQGAIRKAIDLIGGVAGFIKPESRVLVKPNLLMAKEPEFGITTHPEVVRAVIKILKEINCKIFVGDSSDVWGNQIEDADEVYLRSGIKKISEISFAFCYLPSISFLKVLPLISVFPFSLFQSP